MITDSIVAGCGDVAIAVPVRDEAEHLPGLLAALAAQRGAPRFTLCLFLDGCVDRSAAIATSPAPSLPFAVAIDRRAHRGPPNAGRARGRAMALALTHAPDGALLATDADCEPAPDWIAANLAALADADVVAGRVVVAADPPSDRQRRIARYYDGLHAVRRAIDPVAWDGDGTHHWTSGASLAVRAATYRALGGFAPLPRGEDAELCDRAARAGLKVRRDARVVVKTSARRRGRVEGGFADALAALDEPGHEPEVAHPADETWRYRMHAHARRRHGTGDYAMLSSELGLPPAEIEEVARECRNGEAFAARIVGAPPTGLRMVGLGAAEAYLSDWMRSEGTA